MKTPAAQKIERVDVSQIERVDLSKAKRVDVSRIERVDVSPLAPHYKRLMHQSEESSPFSATNLPPADRNFLGRLAAVIGR